MLELDWHTCTPINIDDLDGHWGTVIPALIHLPKAALPQLSHQRWLDLIPTKLQTHYRVRDG